MKKRIRGAIWTKGRTSAKGYYVRKKMSGPRRFRLKENVSGIKHDFDSPSAAKKMGWKIL